jgi:hypothetical protein
MQDSGNPTRLGVIARTCVVHTVTYFAAGLMAMALFDYTRRFQEPPLSLLMRPTSDPLVAGGSLFQPLRGVLFGLVFWLIRDSVFARPGGWLTAWAVVAIIGIVNPFGPAPGSIEGLIYTKIPISIQLAGLSEIVVQSLLLAVITCYWVNHPRKKWLTRTLVTLFPIVLILSALGVADRLGYLKQASALLNAPTVHSPT